MHAEEAYKYWANQYDDNLNKTRDLETKVLRENLNNINFKNFLEIGCGSGKNTEWLINKGENILVIDLSDEMLQIANQKIDNKKVKFLNLDINQEWNFTEKIFNLIVFSLV
ncbi:Methyltransferase domain-containing protein [Soonwooa buanensis]|uniref:Methyltransferase domain-containing protein n=1 Tax=Soonwooa buanensis TaxID=619805 RepID=A0A1T5DM69_9FLAO|nr:class I SAM-dependent methyltransferase [Soonwooa buanensis]SKB72786.1 Methyltransferase domain-containing protein [Soonwooa buanensis]